MLHSDAYLQQTELMAIAAGVVGIKRISTPFVWHYPHLSGKMAAALERLPDVEKDTPPITKNLQLSDPSADTVRQKYQESDSSNSWVFYGSLTNYNGSELARFSAGVGEVGIVKGIWTHLEIRGTIQPPPTPAVGIGTPFDPLAGWRETDFSFHLRLVQRPPNHRSPQFSGNLTRLPGWGYPAIPWWSDGRFAWGVPGEVFFIVPPGCDLRLYVSNHNGTSSQDFSYAFGRLWGYTQPVNRTDTGYNVRHGWT